MKRLISLLMIAMLATCVLSPLGLAEAAASEDTEDLLIGEWSGKASLSKVPFSVPATVRFSEDGTCSISAMGMSVHGSYTIDENTLTVSPSGFEGLGDKEASMLSGVSVMKFTLKIGESSLVVSGRFKGMNAKLNVTRRS